MDSQAYKLLTELYELVTRDENRSLSSAEQAQLKATLHSMLVLYHDESPILSPPTGSRGMDAVEARRPPHRKSKQKWWERFTA